MKKIRSPFRVTVFLDLRIISLLAYLRIFLHSFDPFPPLSPLGERRMTGGRNGRERSSGPLQVFFFSREFLP